MTSRSRSLDEVVAGHAQAFAERIREVASWARSEMDLQTEAVRLLEPFRREAGIDVRPRHNHTIGTGRPDSVYGCVIVEFKKPGVLSAKASAPGNRQVLDQLKDRFRAFRDEEGRSLSSMLGVGCDGRHFVFLRFRDDRWDEEVPVSLDRHSTERFLWALFNMGQKGKPYRPETLASDFGAGSRLAGEGVRDLYGVLTSTKDARTRDFLRQWKILFGEVCGFDVDAPGGRLEELGQTYLVGPRAVPAPLLFAIHTYYALVMKLLAVQVYTHYPRTPSPIREMMGCSDARLRDLLEDLEHGGVFRHFRIRNFLEGDLFSWYLSCWGAKVEGLIHDILTRLDGYNPGTLSEDPTRARDLLKRLYQDLFPRAVRHHLGEYYTPDWLAEHTLDAAGYDGNPDTRLLDPACGSGTFLVLAIARVRRWVEENRERCRYSQGDLLQRILANIVGFDLNPLAVMAARTNYLIAVRDLIPHVGSVEIPVYLCDSVLTPAEHGGDLWSGPVRPLKTAAGVFNIPSEITTDAPILARYTDQLQESVKRGQEPPEFVRECRKRKLPVAAAAGHEALFERLVVLDRANRNGVWARIIKNSFAPLFSRRFDIVVGNPPWVNWENLPGDYREEMKSVWQRYGLFSLKGMAGRLGGGKKDLSMLFAYACTDSYLRQGGRLAFVITQTVFKSKGAGDGFRRFRYSVRKNLKEEKVIGLRVLAVDDLSDFQPFEDATNRTAVFVWEKGRETSYPVPYRLWFKKRKARIEGDSLLPEVLRATDRIPLVARPVRKGTPTSPWLVLGRRAARALEKVIGEAAYRACAGSFTGGLNGAYWVRILDRLPDGNLLVENLHDVGKKVVRKVRAGVEPDLLFPLLRGRDTGLWHASPSAYIVLAQDPDTRRGIEEKRLRAELPCTFDFLKHFEADLRKRKSSSIRALMERGAFYSMFAVDRQTLAPHKVCWPEVGHDLRAGVCSPLKDPHLGRRVIVPDHTVVMVPFKSLDEAHYLAALLNSSPSQAVVRGYVSLHPSPHVLEHIATPRFDPRNEEHQRLAALSREAHDLTRAGAEERLKELLGEVDEAAGRVWDLSAQEIRAIRQSLRLLTPPRRMAEGEEVREGGEEVEVEVEDGQAALP